MSLRRQRGFTLIEILVVMVIIAIIVTLAAVKFGPNDSDIAQREAERLALLLENARDEAIAAGSTLGWSADENGLAYRFWQRDADSQWHPLTDNETLRPRELPLHTRLLSIDVNLAPLAKDGRVSFSPSGVNAPFSLDVRTGDAVRHLSADPLGRITVESPGVTSP
jgi:type II secretion system protein H